METCVVKPSTAGFVATLLGIIALVVHGVLTFMTLLGTGLASTPDTPVPDRAETLWGIALWGTPAAALALFLLLIHWSKPVVLGYTAVWIVLIGCATGGWLAYPDGTTLPIGQIVLHAFVPVASVAVALYGVWSFRASNP